MAVGLLELVEHLDEFLGIRDFVDAPNALNGLQVESDRDVTRLVVAVDACQTTIDAAAQRGAQLMVVHHGLFWGGLQPIVGRHWRRMRTLIDRKIALYAAHLPLDAHPDVGNNAVLARALGVEQEGWFGEYHGRPIGVHGRLEIPRNDLVNRVREQLGVQPTVIATGPPDVARIGIITGGAGDMIDAAREAGLDTYITGEGAHHTYFDAEEWGINVLHAGHYATETVGVKALGAHLGKRFGLDWEFVDHPTGL